MLADNLEYWAQKELQEEREKVLRKAEQRVLENKCNAAS